MERLLSVELCHERFDDQELERGPQHKLSGKGGKSPVEHEFSRSDARASAGTGLPGNALTLTPSQSSPCTQEEPAERDKKFCCRL
jgi:hypothetical protein